MSMETDNSKKELLKLEELSSCYLYISTSDSVLEDKLENVKKFLKGKINFDTDFKVFNGAEEIDEEEFNNYISTPSLFSPKKIAVIKYIEKVSANLQKKVINLISSNSNGGTNVIFIITASKQKFNPALLDAIRKAGKVVQLKSPLSSSLKKWLEEKSKSDEIKFTEEAESLLIENVNLDLNLLKKEYEKLYDYISSEEKKVIDEDTVRFLVSRIYSLKIFDLVDYLGKRDKDNSLKALRSILDEGQNLIGLVTLIHRMFKCFLYIKSGNSKSSVTDYIENNMKVPPYFVGKLVSKYIKLSNNYTEAEVLKVFEILNKYDISFRINTIEGKHLVKKLISEIIDIDV
ncbi:MAG: DNA polymerase III subunit delta [Chloroflexi bacterium]|nr:DNA polymerase III subunit delta [Chloroflexota bacterium]